MSTVSSTSSSTSTINSLMATMNGTSTDSTATDSVSADTDKFMTLLVTQLQNQDPLNPMDNSEMTSQLAQLQTVTGVNNLNTTLNSLLSSYQSSQSIEATSLIGHGVLTAGNSVSLSSSQGILGVELGTAADSVQLVISDSSGNEVQTIDLGAQDAGIVPVAWDGVPDSTNLDSDGNPVTLADGDYTFKVVATRNGTALTDATGLSFGAVSSVTTSGTDGVKVNLSSNSSIKLADVKQVL